MVVGSWSAQILRMWTFVSTVGVIGSFWLTYSNHIYQAVTFVTENTSQRQYFVGRRIPARHCPLFSDIWLLCIYLATYSFFLLLCLFEMPNYHPKQWKSEVIFFKSVRWRKTQIFVFAHSIGENFNFSASWLYISISDLITLHTATVRDVKGFIIL